MPRPRGQRSAKGQMLARPNGRDEIEAPPIIPGFNEERRGGESSGTGGAAPGERSENGDPCARGSSCVIAAIEYVRFRSWGRKYGRRTEQRQSA